MNIITGKGSEDRACAAQKKEEKSAQTSRKGDVSFIFINVYAFTILIEVYQDLWYMHTIPFNYYSELVILAYIRSLQYTAKLGYNNEVTGT